VRRRCAALPAAQLVVGVEAVAAAAGRAPRRGRQHVQRRQRHVRVLARKQARQVLRRDAAGVQRKGRNTGRNVEWNGNKRKRWEGEGAD